MWISGISTQASNKQTISISTISNSRLPKDSLILVPRGAFLVFVFAMIVSSLPQTAAIDLLADLVCDHDQCEADKAVEHANRRTIAELCINQTFTVNIGVDDIGGIINCGVVQQHNALITDIEDLTHLQNQHDEWVEAFKDYINIEKLTRDVVIELIEKIEVHEDGGLDIYYRFRNPFQVAN